MLTLLEALFAAGATVVVGAPSLTGSVSLTSFAGSCAGAGVSATLTVAWTVTNPDDVAYEIRVLQNGVLISTQATTSPSYLKTVEGYIVGGTFHRFTSNWTYTVQLVRKADGVTVDTKTSSLWAVIYGTCSLAA